MRPPLCARGSRPLAVSALFLFSASTFGCAGTRPPPAPSDARSYVIPAVEAPRQPREETASELVPLSEEDIRRVDPTFRQTFREYDGEVERASSTMAADTASMRRAIVLLADAIETIPHAEHVNLQAAAMEIREARLPPMVAQKLQATAGQEHRGSLEAAATVLAAVARGPYRRFPSVASQARTFQSSVERLHTLRALSRSEDWVLEALVEARRTLRGILEAAARMEVPA
jgi:hypothetical protein